MNIQHDYSGAGTRFEQLARRYCSLVDAASAVARTEFLIQLYCILPELIAEAIRLPQVEFDEDEDEEQEASIRQIRARAEMKHEEWAELYDSLKQKLGEWDLYWQVFDPRTDKEAIEGSLADDIAGIYQDLKNGIRLKETDSVPIRDVVFDWRLKFYFHWGKHAIDALRTMHFLLQEKLE